MIFLDTAYLIALFDVRDALHARASAWSNVLDEPAVLTEYVLLETVNYFSRPRERNKAYALLDHVTKSVDYEVVRVDPALFGAGLARYRDRPEKGWSLTDCVSFVVMRGRELDRALAYDHHFEQAGFEALLRRDP